MNDSIFTGAFTFAQTVEPWFRNGAMLGAILGSSVGVFGGTYGTLAGILAPRGKAKSLIFAMHWTGVALGLALIAVSIAALSLGQPYVVWYGLGLPGVILTLVLLPLTGVIKQRYREAEQRRLEAESFKRG